MSQINNILMAAKQRAESLQLPYSGALLPEEAFTLLQNVPAAKLVDVRSNAEWNFVGVIPGAVNVEWKTFPGMIDNPHFLEQLKHQVDTESLVMFIPASSTCWKALKATRMATATVAKSTAGRPATCPGRKADARVYVGCGTGRGGGCGLV